VPEATIVLGHMGAYFHGRDALAVAERRENVMLETSACPYPGLIGEAVRRVGAERVIFGSDGPGCPPAIELDKVRRAGLSHGDFRKVVYENQRALMDRVER
jgi:predicted TIM-barrel fold metal-dependent hydrolase